MKQFRKTALFLIVVLLMSVISPVVVSNAAQAQSVIIRLSRSDLTLLVGQTYTLAVKGSTSKATWSTSDKDIATVNKGGKVTAINVGKAIITAKVNKVKYTCVIAVKKVPSPYIENAPFSAREADFDNISIIYPGDWDNDFYTYGKRTVMNLLSPSATYTTDYDTQIYLNVYDLEHSAPDYEEEKSYLQDLFTTDYILSSFTDYADPAYSFSVTDVQTSDADTAYGKAFKVSYNVSYSSSNDSGYFKDTIYMLYYDHYYIEMDITDNQNSTTPDLYKVGDYILNSLQIIE